MEEQLYFNIRSKECTQVTNNADLIVNMPFSIDIADDEWLQVEVISAEIPNSFYNISTALQNNIFTYFIFGTINITIPNGSYTVDSLISFINSAQMTFVMSYNDTFNKIAVTAANPVTFTYDPNSYTQQLFGIISTQVISTATYFGGVVNLASVHSVLIRSSLNSGNSASTSQSNNDIICKVPLSVNYGGILIYNNNDFTRKNIIKSGSIRQFYIKLTEQNQKILDLNSCVWEMTILFTKIKHDLNTVSEEQRQRRTNNYIAPPPPPPPPPPITQPPVMQPTYQPSSSYTSESSTPQNEGDKTENEPPLINENEDILSNDEIQLIKKQEELPVKPVEPPIVMNEPPKIDPYKNLDNLLLSLLTD